MPHRQFKDKGEIVWEVWDVHPIEVTRRLTGKAPERDDRSFRRTNVNVARELASGWLCFESSYGKRRLSPIPAEWDRLSDTQLSDLCARATQAPTKRNAS